MFSSLLLYKINLDPIVQVRVTVYQIRKQILSIKQVAFFHESCDPTFTLYMWKINSTVRTIQKWHIMTHVDI